MLPNFGTWECFRKDGFARALVIKENDVVKDITGWSFAFMVKDDRDDPDTEALITKALTLSGTPTDGTASLALTSTDTDIDPGTYYFDIKMIPLGGAPRTIEGTFIISQRVHA
jgi:hypothetical protein